MIAVAQINTSGLNLLMYGIQNALVGQGADCSSVTRNEARLLALEISKRVGPRNKSRKELNVRREVSRVFAPKPREMFSKQKQGHSNMQWLVASPQFLIGIKRDHVFTGESSNEQLFRAFLKAPGLSLGKKYTRIGSHGEQAVYEMNRIMILRGAFNNFVRFVQKRIGIMRASWVADAKKIDPMKPAASPDWVSRHVPGNRAQIVYLNGLKNLESPSITFGSNAVGIEKFTESIRFAVKVREKKMAARLKLIISGYAKDVAKGIRPGRHRH
jgi:hypothetical protein